jgi:glycosyltransferase involved in cell wall biosynthesis
LTDNLYSFIESSGIGHRVRFIGYTSDDDLRALYSSCRVCVYPSFYEGFGLPPLEAMACGAPVITSRVPALEETVGKAAFLFNPVSVDELAAAIIQLWNSPERRLQLSKAGVQRAADFTWEKTARLTLDVYREVLSSKARGAKGQAALPN